MKSAFSLGDRMKLYEKNQKILLPIRTPIIMRIDGRHFHTFTKGMRKPFDESLILMMNDIGTHLCEKIPGIQFAYLQSDEINLLIYYENPENRWFNNNIQKLTSVSASMASSFAMKWKYLYGIKIDSLISFDSRVFTLPPQEVENYFIWRQQDWTRNSVQMFARSLYSHNQLSGKNQQEMLDMIHNAGENWNRLGDIYKRGRCILKQPRKVDIENEHFTGTVERNIWEVDMHIPIFTENRDYIRNLSKNDCII